MRIQHNIMAMNAYRNYTNNVSAMKKNLEKLSSGYKINRAGDDAAGLAISEKMRAQITGLETAQKNAKDGISLVQTAEGALTEVHDMLNRMVELATQSANGTYDNTTDRNQMQKEIDQLRSEINRIADSSNFNGIKLLDGSMDGADKVGEAANVSVTAHADGDQSVREGVKPVYSFDIKDLKLLGDGTTATIASMTIGGAALTINSAAQTVINVANFNPDDLAAAIVTGTGGAVTIGDMKYEVTAEGSKIKLSAVSIPTTAASLNTALVVAVTTDPAAGTNNSYDIGVHMDVQGEPMALPKVAQGNFALNRSHVKDGSQLTIGKETYTFKVGKDSTVSGSNIIDLSEYEDGDTDLIRAATTKLTQQNNSMFDITTDTQAVARAFARMEKAFLPLCYAPGALTADKLFLLPPMHRFGFYCAQAFDALDTGDGAGYVRLLREGLEVCEGVKPMVEFLVDHTPELQAKPEPSEELKALADQVRAVLANFSPDDPAVAALKQSEAYQKVAYLIEGMDVPVVGGLKQ